jgi:putative CocE/NonD family hydrolase
VFQKYLGEGQDGFDTLDWARAQDWCSGAFGTFGLSYSAHTQTALAILQPHGLQAMFLDSGGFWNAYQGGVRRGGAFELKQATWAFKHARLSPAASDPVVAAALDAEDIADWFAAMPWRRGLSPLRHVPEYEDYLLDQWERGAFDTYWQVPELYCAPHYPALSRIPVFLVCGWYDPYAETILEHYKGWRAHGGQAELVMGPWLHGRRSQTHAGDVDFGAQSVLDGAIAPDYDTLRLSWFDRWLKPGAAPAPSQVRWFCMGGGPGTRDGQGRRKHDGAWRQDASWPPSRTAPQSFYLSPTGALETQPTGDGTILLQTDPDHPVPTIGGALTSGAPVMEGGAYDQVTTPHVFGATAPYLPLAARRDVLVFATPPLTEHVEIAGPVEVHLTLSTDAPDADITVKLVDWAPANADYPQGFAMNLCDGILRLRYREDWSKPRPMTPDNRVEVVIPATPTAALFRAGHRIRIDIAGSNFPRFDVNPQTGEPEGQARGQRIATTTLHLGTTQARLVLSVVQT